MATTTAADVRTIRPSRARTMLILAGAALAAIVGNALIAALAGALGAPAGYGPLTLPAYGLFSILGVGVGWLGWRLVHRRARDPRRMLAVLVPVVALVSFIPDVLLLVFRFIPGTTDVGVYALMLMHVVVIAIAVPAYALASRDSRRERIDAASEPRG